SSSAYTRIRQSGDECLALPATGSARLPSDGDGAGRLGAFDEKRTDHRQLQELAAQASCGALDGSAAHSRVGRNVGAVFQAARALTMGAYSALSTSLNG